MQQERVSSRDFFIIRWKNFTGFLRKSETYCFLLMEQGEIKIRIRDHYSLLNENNLILIPPYQGSQCHLEKFCGYEFHLNPHIFHLLKKNEDFLEFSFDLKKQPVLIFLLNNEFFQFRSIFKTISQELSESAKAYDEILKLKIREIFLRLIRLDRVSEEMLSKRISDKDEIGYQGRITEILKFLKSHFTENLSLKQISDRFGFSPGYLSRYFKAKTKENLFQHINKLRIKRACVLLQNTDDKIIEIAYQVGFNNLSFFNRCFKNLLNQTPYEYRNPIFSLYRVNKK